MLSLVKCHYSWRLEGKLTREKFIPDSTDHQALGFCHKPANLGAKSRSGGTEPGPASFFRLTGPQPVSTGRDLGHNWALASHFAGGETEGYVTYPRSHSWFTAELAPLSGRTPCCLLRPLNRHQSSTALRASPSGSRGWSPFSSFTDLICPSLPSNGCGVSGSNVHAK